MTECGRTLLSYNYYQLVLPLKDLFCNRELEFDITLSNLKIAFENLGLSQPNTAFATQNLIIETFELFNNTIEAVSLSNEPTYIQQLNFVISVVKDRAAILIASESVGNTGRLSITSSTVISPFKI